MAATCLLCREPAVFLHPSYCKRHFLQYIEDKVRSSIERFGLVHDGERIAVAVSGGKDSQTTLYLLHKFYGDRVQAISIDEGIPGYRDHTLEDLQEFCKRYSIAYFIHSFEQAFGKTLEKFLAQGASPCRSCGVLRRHLLNSTSKDFDVLATGHNLDDECQNIVMNFLKGNLFLCAKLGPASGIVEREGFTQRIKPLYLCTEKEIMAYAFLQGFPVRFKECPHSFDSFRSHVRDTLNDIEQRLPGTKRAIVEHFLSLLPHFKKIYEDTPPPIRCVQCGSPAMNERCQACKTLVAFPYVN